MGVMGEVKLCVKMAQFDTKKCAVASLKRIAQGKKRVHGKRKRNPWLIGKKKKKKKRRLPQLLKVSWTNVSRKWLLSPRPKGWSHLPKSIFWLDEFKQNCSNEATLSVALWYFGEHFDKDGWSIWYAESASLKSLSSLSWVVTSSQECTRDWTNGGRMPFLVLPSLEPTTTDLFLVFGSTEAKRMPLHWV